MNIKTIIDRNEKVCAVLDDNRGRRIRTFAYADGATLHREIPRVLVVAHCMELPPGDYVALASEEHDHPPDVGGGYGMTIVPRQGDPYLMQNPKHYDKKGT